MRRRILESMPEEWKEAYAAGIFTEFMEQRGPGHTVGSAKLYEKGYLDYQEDIRAALAKLDYQSDPEALNKRDQLNAMLIACDAIMILGKRYGELAREMAAGCADEQRKKELLQIAANCKMRRRIERSSQYGMIFSSWTFRSSSVTEKLTTFLSFMFRMSSSVWQHSSGKVGADWG